MKTTLLRLVAIVGILVFVGGIVPVAYAATPTLSVSATGNGDSVQLVINGDPNAAVWLSKSTYSGTQQQYLGTTNFSGYLSVSISSSSGLVAGNYVYVTVNGQSSQQIAWPSSYGYYGGSGSIFLSQTNVNLVNGQSVSVSISGGSQPYTQYSGSNVNNVFQSVISGNTLTLTGLNSGSGSLNICSAGGANSGCATVFVTVNGYSTNPNPSYSQISLSQNSISLNSGSLGNVTIYGLSGNYAYISTNSNPSVVSANISGNTLYLNGLANGTSNIVVCQNSGQCATLYVTVVNGFQQNYLTVPPITFSQNSLALGTSQTGTVTVSGGSGTGYYVAYTMPGGSAQASLNGNTLTVTSLNSPAGSVGIIVCSSAGTCGGLTVSLNSGYVQGNQGWTYCSEENGFCSFTGTRNVQYGANGQYYYRTVTNGTPCTNAVFGDPIFRVAKRCSFQ